jgi:murein DD-endopeptidase MepM/ murein hydrolase activator NlpD
VDGTPPTVAILVAGVDQTSDVALGPVRGRGVWALRVADARPGVHATRVRVDGGEPILMKDPAELTVDTNLLQDGPHSFRMEVVDRSIRRNATVISGTFVSDNSPPGLEIAAASLAGTQGKTLAVWVRADEDVDRFRGRLLRKERTFHAVGPANGDGERLFRALIGLPVDAKLGRVGLELLARDRAGNVKRSLLAVQIEEGKFAKGGRIRLTKRQEEAREQTERIRAVNIARRVAFADPEPEQLWTDPFIVPVRGRRTSSFGKFRTYSDGAKKHHFGVDIANRTGTPVFAAASGRVVLAEEQQIYGKVVIVHHGQGIATSYNHLHDIEVGVGDSVERGRRVGTVGSTGQSTGPHLHWGMSVDGVPVDAMQWVGEVFAPPASDATWIPISEIELKPKSS